MNNIGGIAWLAAAVFTSAATGAAQPSGDGAAPPAIVAKDLKAVADQCREVGGKPLMQGAIKRADLNGDGLNDFVLDIGSVQCDGAASVYGDRQKGVSVYVGDGKGGASKAFEDWVFGATIEGKGTAAKLWLTVAGSGCGKKPAANFATENFCDRALVWIAQSRKFDYAPVSTVRMIK